MRTCSGVKMTASHSLLSKTYLPSGLAFAQRTAFPDGGRSSRSIEPRLAGAGDVILHGPARLPAMFPTVPRLRFPDGSAGLLCDAGLQRARQRPALCRHLNAWRGRR